VCGVSIVLTVLVMSENIDISFSVRDGCNEEPEAASVDTPDSDAAAADSDDGDDDYEITLQHVVVVFTQIKKMIGLEEEKLGSETLPSREVIYSVKAAAARLHGDMDDLQCDLDDLNLATNEEKAIRKKIIEDLSDLYDQVYALDDRCVELLKTAAEEEKKLGNECFKNGKFTDAAAHYGVAIAIDSNNPLFYSNRALAYQKLELFANAIDDAREAVELDVNFLKGYVILVKCYLATNNVIGCMDTFAAVPNAFQEQKDVVELKVLASVAAKDQGNAFFKEGRIDDAIRFYSMAIDCTPENHLFYSNRSAAYQTKSMWTEALKDAEKCVHVSETFPKGYLHMARCQLQLKRYPDAESTVNMAMIALNDTPELQAITPQLNEIMESVRLAGVCNCY
jgi:tetratricopeptide (TPR) repeat protein